QSGVLEPEAVGVVDPAVRPGGPDDARNEVGQGAVLRLAGAQLRLGPLAFGDVAEDDHGTANATGLVAERARAGADPGPLSRVVWADEHFRVVHILAPDGARRGQFLHGHGGDHVGAIESAGPLCRVERLLLGAAGDPFPRWVDEDQATIRVG